MEGGPCAPQIAATSILMQRCRSSRALPKADAPDAPFRPLLTRKSWRLRSAAYAMRSRYLPQSCSLMPFF
eukprot:3762277-Pleurochrysis_carterae.AAC.1